jgi:isopentenyl diphosphate isomerase/L-lactate dehydrogenase-like FMN-dependent dehydrogenase
VERVIDLMNREFAICMRGSGTPTLAAIDESRIIDTGRRNPDMIDSTFGPYY